MLKTNVLLHLFTFLKSLPIQYLAVGDSKAVRYGFLQRISTVATIANLLYNNGSAKHWRNATMGERNHGIKIRELNHHHPFIATNGLLLLTSTSFKDRPGRSNYATASGHGLNEFREFWNGLRTEDVRNRMPTSYFWWVNFKARSFVYSAKNDASYTEHAWFKRL